MTDFERDREDHIRRISTQQGIVERTYGIWHLASRYGGSDRRRRLTRLLLFFFASIAFLFVLAIVGSLLTR